MLKTGILRLFVLGLVTLFLSLFLTKSACSGLIYLEDNQFLHNFSLKNLFLSTTGICFYFLALKYISKYKELIAFLVLASFWIAIFIEPFQQFRKKNNSDSAMTKEICGKINDDSMIFKATSLSFSEYKYLQEKLRILPSLNAYSDSIDIFYYRDGFLPDFMLNLTFSIPKTAYNKEEHNNFEVLSKDSLSYRLYYSDGAQ